MADGQVFLLHQSHRTLPAHGLGDEIRIKSPEDGSVTRYRITEVRVKSSGNELYGLPLGPAD